MEKQKVIDFLVKSGIWVENNSIKKSDLSKATALVKQALAKVVSQKHFKMSVAMPNTIDVKSEIYVESGKFIVYISARVNAGSPLNGADWIIVDTYSFDKEDEAISLANKKIKNFKIQEA